MPEQMSRRLKTALANLIEETPELAGWSFSVSLAQASDEIAASLMHDI